MSFEFPQIKVLAQAPPRQPPNQPGQPQPTEFYLQSVAVSCSWGSAPATASLVYVGDTPVAVGAWVIFNVGINVFNGLCKSCVETVSTGSGQAWLLEFADLREYLTWDYVYGAFNKPDIRTAGGVRLKRYKHLLPDNFDGWRWTYTEHPLLGWEILEYIFKAPTVGTPWSWDLTDRGLFYEGVLSGPVLDLDFTNGRRLDAALNELCAKAGGVVFSLIPFTSRPYQLVFTRKGYLPLTYLPDWIRDDQRQGEALSGNPTNVRILGDRNLYQLMDVPLVPDWARAWEQFLVFEQFADYIFRNGTNFNGNSPYYGRRFNAYPNDPEQYIGRQEATATAMETTVRDFVEFLNVQDPVNLPGNAFKDTRRFSGRSRMLMPVALYLEQLVFRAFKPNLTSFVNAAGQPVPLDALNLADNLLCRVDHNAGTGAMSFDASQPVEGNGYAIVQGYNVIPDMLHCVQSEQFNLSWFVNTYAAWGMKGFQIDDSGEGNRFLIFDDPIIICDPANPLVVQIGNHAVINATATLLVPPARAALTFEAEPYSFWRGTYPNVSRDHCENVNGLNQELVVQTSGSPPRTHYTEIAYANGRTADAAAADVADFLLVQQYFYWEGGVTHRWAGEPLETWGTQLSSLIDRVQYRVSPAEGLNETIDLTRERRTDRFEPERELDRRTVQSTLFPGQMELRHKAELLRQTALSLRQLPPAVMLQFRKFMIGGISDDGPVAPVFFKPGTAAQTPTGTLPAGSIIRRQPVAPASGDNPNTNTVADFAPVLDAGKDKRIVFIGVTPVHNLDATRPFNVKTGGPALARVAGPVAVNDVVGLSSDGTNNLVKGGVMPQGTALEAITDTSVKLIKVRLGHGGGSGGGSFRGEYDPGASYNVQDVVVIRAGANAGSYVCIKGNSAQTPAVPDTGNLYWLSLSGNAPVMGAWMT